MKPFKQFDEAVKGQDTESRKEGAKERAADKKSGKIRKNTLDPKDYATQQKKSIEWHDKRTKGRYTPGQVSDVHEVAPPGWGHTKAEKEKTDPSKPKSKVGGSSAAFKRALDDGRFKGLPGDKTKKDKVASMFKLMWSMKKKGAKPHYKPGTDEKYEKYQDESVNEGASIIQGGTSSKKVSYRGATSEKSQPKKSASFRGEKDESIPSKHKSARYGSQLHRLRPRSERLANESLGFTIDSGEHKKASKKAKIRNLAKGNTNPNEKAAAEKKAGGPKLIGEVLSGKDTKKLAKASVLSTSDDPKKQDRARARQVEIDYKDLMDQRKKKKVGVGKSMREEKKSCPEGEYYCFDMGKCRPIPDGHKVREDGELVKEGVRGAAIGAAVGGVVAGPLGAAAGAAIGASSGSGKKRVAAYNKGREAVQSVKDKARKIKQNIKGAQEKRRKAAQSAMEGTEIHDAKGNLYATVIDIIKPQPMKVPESSVKWQELTELRKLPNYNKTGNIIDVYLAWRGKNYIIQTFFPQVKKPSRKEVIDQIQKVYPGCRVWNYQIGTYNPGEPILQTN